MIVITMNRDASVKDIGSVLRKIEALGFKPHLAREDGQTTIGLVGSGMPVKEESFLALAGVETLEPVATPFQLGGRGFRKRRTEVEVGNVAFGGKQIIVIAGPCSVESSEQMSITANAVTHAGASVLRGGAFKPRTSPYSFKGLGEEGLKILADAREQTGCPIVTEVLSAQDVALVSRYADMLQIGSRNMQNYSLLEAMGDTDKPVFLKRGLMSTIEELLLAAEYILAAGNPNVVLCERGIRSFEQYTRNTLDIAAVPLLKQLSHLPVVVDPSHATGRRDLVIPVAMAAVAAGADGLMIEVHHDPDNARSDGPQSLLPEQFKTFMDTLEPLAQAMGRQTKPVKSATNGSRANGGQLSA